MKDEHVDATAVEHTPELLAQLVRHEGLYLTTYRCPAGKLTIGVGHNLEANPIPDISAGCTISRERALRILKEDVGKYAASLDRFLPWWRGLDLPRQAVLLDMTFNMGINGMLTFKNTLESIRTGNYADAASRMMESKWAGQVKFRAIELSEQMRRGQWQGPKVRGWEAEGIC